MERVQPAELRQQIALTLIPQVGPQTARQLLASLGSIEAVFNASRQELERIPDVGPTIAKNIASWHDTQAVEAELRYVEEKLRILSGFYGVLRPMDAVTPYRLEMQAKAAVAGHKNLYAFWGDKLYRAVRDESAVIINLASKEYSKAIEAYLQPEDRYITCVFGELLGGKVVQKGVYAKMARGEMVRYLAEIGAEQPEELKGFSRSGYVFREELSTETNYVFAREPGTYEDV